MPAAGPFTTLFAHLADHPLVRRGAWLLFVSWVVALTLTGYLFGFADGFFGKLFGATFVLWLLAAGTALGIVPLVRWLTQRLSGRSNPPPRHGRSVSSRRPAGRSTGSSTIPASKWR